MAELEILCIALLVHGLLLADLVDKVALLTSERIVDKIESRLTRHCLDDWLYTMLELLVVDARKGRHWVLSVLRLLLS